MTNLREISLNWIQNAPTADVLLPMTDNDQMADSKSVSRFENILSYNPPILESFLLQAPTNTIFQLYHTSSYLRNFLRTYPTAWKYLSFRLLNPSSTVNQPIANPSPDANAQRQSRPYALDQLLLTVVNPFSSCLKSLELDNTAVSGQILTSTVLSLRRETLEHLSVRGCKNVSLKYHIVPWLTVFGLQRDVEPEVGSSSTFECNKLALKSLYTYRCRHHRRRPYLPSSLLRRDSDSEPTHELVNICHKLGIWTDTAWCTTPGGRCYRRRGYVTMRAPQGTPEVWVVYDRLWRSKNWLGPVTEKETKKKRDGRIWEQDEAGCYGEALGTGEGGAKGEGKMLPAHLRRTHKDFNDDVKCDNCGDEILERCEQCSVLMHCVGCRKTLCASCAYERPLHRHKQATETDGKKKDDIWWAPGLQISPCNMQQEPPDLNVNVGHAPGHNHYPPLRFRWCCTEPMFSGGGAITFGGPGVVSREVERVRAAPLPRGQGWEDPEFNEDTWAEAFPEMAHGPVPPCTEYTSPTDHSEMMRWLLGPPGRPTSNSPRNLCDECYDSDLWKVQCKTCSKPLCMEHDLRGLRLRICGYKDLALEKMSIKSIVPRRRDSSGGDGAEKSKSIPHRFHKDSIVAFTQQVEAVEQSSTASTSSALTAPSPNTGTNSDLSLFVDDSGAEDNRPSNRHDSPTSSPRSNNSRSSSPSSVYFDAPGDSNAPVWIGCRSFFCPQYRAAGDHRSRCPSILKECANCATYVCSACLADHPSCKCSHCESNFYCPNCRVKKERDGTCKRAEEIRKKQEDEKRKQRQVFEEAVGRKLADEVGGYVGTFFDVVVRGRHQQNTAESLGWTLPHVAHVERTGEQPTTDHIEIEGMD